MCNITCSSRSQSSWCAAGCLKNKCTVVTHIKKRLREINRRRVWKAEIIVVSMEELKVVFLPLWGPRWWLYEYAFGPHTFGCGILRWHACTSRLELKWFELSKKQWVPAITFRIEREFCFLSQDLPWSPWRISTEFRVLPSRPNQIILLFFLGFLLHIFQIARDFLWSLCSFHLKIESK